MFLRPASAEQAIFQQFDCALHAYKPLASPERLANSDIPFPVSIVYGETDWMDSRGSREIVKLNQYFESGDSQLHILAKSGH